MTTWMDDIVVVVTLTLLMLWFIVLPVVGLWHVVMG